MVRARTLHLLTILRKPQFDFYDMSGLTHDIFTRIQAINVYMLQDIENVVM